MQPIWIYLGYQSTSLNWVYKLDIFYYKTCMINTGYVNLPFKRFDCMEKSIRLRDTSSEGCSNTLNSKPDITTIVPALNKESIVRI